MAGYEVVMAENGSEGLELAKSGQPDLVLLDIILPKMNGYEVLEKIRGDEATKNLVVYLCSNLGQAAEIQKGMAEGANGYLIKSAMTPSQLVGKIAAIFAAPSTPSIDSGQAPAIITEAKNKAVKKYSKNSSNLVQPDEQKIRVLIIEDEAAIVKMYQSRLEKEGCAVITAQNGAWGLKKAKEGGFDVILMDMNMPAMNGYQAIVELKKNEQTKNTPIMILSNSAQDRDIAEALKLGAACFILKSKITPGKLVEEIKKYYPELKRIPASTKNLA